MQIDNPVTSGDAATPARDGFYNLAKATFAFQVNSDDADNPYNAITTATVDSVTTPSIEYFWHSAASEKPKDLVPSSDYSVADLDENTC